MLNCNVLAGLLTEKLLKKAPPYFTTIFWNPLDAVLDSWHNTSKL